MDFTELDNFLLESVRKKVVPGFVLLFGKHDKIAYKRAFGHRQIIPEHLPMTLNTSFDIASITKSVSTASLMMILENDGVLSFEDKVGRFFPKTLNSCIGSLPIKLLMCHRSGLPAWSPYFLKITKGKKAVLVGDSLFSKDNKKIVLDAIFKEKLLFSPGSKEVYSDIGYILLGEIIEKASGLSISRLFSEKIAKPMRLHKTAFRPSNSENLDENIASSEDCPWREKILKGCVHDDNAFILGGAAGHAGLFSTAEDLFNFISKLFRAYKFTEPAPIAQKTLKQCWKRVKGGGSWTLGWDTPTPGKSTSGNYFSTNSVGAIGFTGCTVWLDLDRGVVAVLLANKIHPNRRSNPEFGKFRQELHNKVMRSFFGMHKARGVKNED